MLKLIILRHAKSSWSQPGQNDFDRDLNKRGQSDLPKIARAIEEHGHIPDTIYCSPANRTKLTMQGIVENWSKSPEVHFVRDMYVGGASAYMQAIHDHDGQGPIMLVGHNPTCHSLALNLSAPDSIQDQLAVKYPTGTATILEFSLENWRDIAPGTGKLIDFMMPRTL